MDDTIDFSEAASYRKVGSVEAVQLDENRSWNTTGGDELRGSAGDWLVSDGTSEWTVNDDVFSATYAQNTDGTWTKSALIRAVQVDAPTLVRTLEGDATAAPGDWVAENPSGERWPIPRVQFERSYELA